MENTRKSPLTLRWRFITTYMPYLEALLLTCDDRNIHPTTDWVQRADAQVRGCQQGWYLRKHMFTSYITYKPTATLIMRNPISNPIDWGRQLVSHRALCHAIPWQQLTHCEYPAQWLAFAQLRNQASKQIIICSIYTHCWIALSIPTLSWTCTR